jgi:hypothetical protein
MNRYLPVSSAVLFLALIFSTAAVEANPPPGRYVMRMNGSAVAYFLFKDNGTYEYFTMANAKLSEGEYTVEGDRVRWKSGTFHQNGYGGSYYVKDNEHVIRLGVTTAAYLEP